MAIGAYDGMEFPEKLERSISRSGKSQSGLARETGIDQSAISAMTRGQRRPYMDQALKLARALGVPLDYLADDALDELPGPDLTEQERTVLLMVRTLGTEEAIRRLVRPVELGAMGSDLGGEEIVAIRDLTPPPGRGSKIVRPNRKDKGSDAEDLPGRIKR